MSNPDHKSCIPDEAAAGFRKTLRSRAVERLRAQEDRDLEALGPEETKRLVHELEVQHIELEIQNEDLRRTQEELDKARIHYFDLYDFAPVGYVSVNEAGAILLANLTAAAMLGLPRGVLIKQPLSRFILPEDQGIYYKYRKKLYAEYSQGPDFVIAPHACELRMVKEDDGTLLWVYLETTLKRNIENKFVFRSVLSNITKLKQAEESLAKALKDEINALRGIIPICANCKKIRDDRGYWNEVETYIQNHSSALFSHGICPECINKLYPDLLRDIPEK
jgi:PAS domain S-box-containing protein